MPDVLLVFLLSSSFLLAQASDNPTPAQQTPADSTGQVTLEGCLDRSRGDYILMQTDPGNDVRAAFNRQVEATPLHGATGRSHRHEVSLAEHKFGRHRIRRFTVTGDIVGEVH